MANPNITEWEGESSGKDHQEIDLIGMLKKLWHRKRTICIWSGCGAILGLIIAFSLPREYTTEVILAPEFNDAQGKGSGLSALAAMAGVGSSASGDDAVYPNLYPDILKSVPFCVSLFDVPLTNADGDQHFNVQEFLQNDTKSPWWSVITGFPRKVIGWLSSKKKSEAPGQGGPNAFRLTEEEDKLVQQLNGRIDAIVDTKTSVVTISVKMQDPMVSALLADTVVSRLRDYVIEYRTNKARQDVFYLEQLNQEAKEKYYQAQQRFADYLDTHQGIALYSVRTMRDRLENEATLAFNVYNQTSQQLQVAKAKVQEVTPVFATITPATVPLKPSAPRKVLILVGCVFLAFVACCSYILFVEPLRAQPGSQPE